MENRFEVLKILVFLEKNLHRYKKVGFMLQDMAENKTLGCTFEEAFELIQNEGCTNAEATFYTVEQHGYEGKNIHPLPHLNLPSYNDPSWHLPMLNEEFLPHVPYTDQLLTSIHNTIKLDIRWNYEVKKRKWKRRNHEVYTELYGVEMKNKYRQLADLINGANHIVFLTGAGLGTESGIPDFRGSENIYSNGAFMHIMTVEYRDQHPEEFFYFIKELLYTLLEDILPFRHISALKSAIENLRPNESHKFISRLESQKKNVTVITQNVDGLHEKAGNKKVIPIHGDISVFYCNKCNDSIPLLRALELENPGCHQAGCKGVYHPHIDLFGYNIHDFDFAKKQVKAADLFIVAGTSLQVYPTSTLVEELKNAKKVIVNHQPTDTDSKFDLVIHGPASTVFGEVELVLSNKSRSLCSVCNQNVAEGVYASRIAPTSYHYCQRCMDAPAEPYHLVVYEVAWRTYKIKNYTISPRLKVVRDATLSITGKTLEEFNIDVEKEVKRFKDRDNKKNKD